MNKKTWRATVMDKYQYLGVSLKKGKRKCFWCQKTDWTNAPLLSTLDTTFFFDNWTEKHSLTNWTKMWTSGLFYKRITLVNEGRLAASFYHQTASWVPHMFCNFYLVKNHKIVSSNSLTTKAREKVWTDLKSLEF